MTEKLSKEIKDKCPKVYEKIIKSCRGISGNLIRFIPSFNIFFILLKDFFESKGLTVEVKKVYSLGKEPDYWTYNISNYDDRGRFNNIEMARYQAIMSTALIYEEKVA